MNWLKPVGAFVALNRLPYSAGDILVFLTGQEDIEKAVKMISEKVAGLDEECGDLLPLPM